MDLKSAQSYHEGGVQVLMMDGTVHFVSENVDHGLWIDSGGMDDGQTGSVIQ